MSCLIMTLMAHRYFEIGHGLHCSSMLESAFTREVWAMTGYATVLASRARQVCKELLRHLFFTLWVTRFRLFPALRYIQDSSWAVPGLPGPSSLQFLLLHCTFVSVSSLPWHAREGEGHRINKGSAETETKWRLSEERRQSLRNMPVTEQKRRRFWIEERGPDSW